MINIAAFAGQQRGVGVIPLVVELVAHIGQPPGDQLVDGVDAGHQPGLRAAASRSLPEPDMQLARRPQIGAPVADVEHRGLVDSQPQQRRGEIVPGSRQVLAPSAGTAAMP